MTISQRIVLRFPSALIDRPVISEAIKRFDLDFNILQAQISPQQEGIMVIVLSGDEKMLKNALAWLAKKGVHIQPLKQDIVKNETRCTQCGVCVGLCPTQALFVDKSTAYVRFDPEKCIACLFCVKGCMMHAMEVTF